MKEPRFYKKNGKLTAYGLRCGYVEHFRKFLTSVKLWEEHSTYHVRVTRDKQANCIIIWECFEKVNDAWLLFNKEVSKL